MEHTPLPWSLEDLGPDTEGPRFAINGADGRLVATVVRPDDAARIVREVNSHEDVLTTCRMVIKHFDGVKRTCLSSDLEASLDAAKVSLAKAEEAVHV